MALSALNFSSLGIGQSHKERNIISAFEGFEARRDAPCNRDDSQPTLHVFTSTHQLHCGLNSHERTRNTLLALQSERCSSSQRNPGGQIPFDLAILVTSNNFKGIARGCYDCSDSQIIRTQGVGSEEPNKIILRETLNL